MQQDGFHGGHFPEAGPRNCKRALARFVPVFVKHASAPETVGTLLECVFAAAPSTENTCFCPSGMAKTRDGIVANQIVKTRNRNPRSQWQRNPEPNLIIARTFRAVTKLE